MAAANPRMMVEGKRSALDGCDPARHYRHWRRYGDRTSARCLRQAVCTIDDLFDDPSKRRQSQGESIILPTTCGNRSEVTTVAVFFRRASTHQAASYESLYLTTPC